MPFEHAKEMIKHARSHIAKFAKIEQEYISSEPFSFEERQVKIDIGEREIDRIEFFWRRRIDPPLSLGLEFGSACQSIRSAMDYIAWSIFEAEGCPPSHNPKKVQYPFASDPDRFPRVLEDCLGFAKDSVKHKVVSIGTFPGGNGAELYSISEFANMSKHRSIQILPMYTEEPRLFISFPHGGGWLMDGNFTVGLANGSEERSLGCVAPGSKVSFAESSNLKVQLAIFALRYRGVANEPHWAGIYLDKAANMVEMDIDLFSKSY